MLQDLRTYSFLRKFKYESNKNGGMMSNKDNISAQN